MKNLPNYLTIGNLICGCIAIVLILTERPYLAEGLGWVVLRDHQIMLGSLFIFLAAVFDFLDGTVARLLRIHSPIGKDLDSLADIVSFGVAPSMIAFQGIWESMMNKPGALDINLIWTIPAFLLAAAGAWRLAVFNQRPPQSDFIGVPIPVSGIFFASLPLLYWLGNPPVWIDQMLHSASFWYITIFIFSYLMNSRIPFRSLKLHGTSWSDNQFPYLMMIIGVTLIVLFQFAAIPLLVLIYLSYNLFRWLVAK